jgi:hypothetical protein
MFVSTNTIIIYWYQWAWKTALAVMMWTDYLKRLYWNIEIKQNWKNVWTVIKDMSDISKLKYSKTPWMILFDEMWLNFNSKEHWTDKNKILSNFFFLVRKFNLSSVFISQRFTSIPVDMRELCSLIYKVEIVPIKWEVPKFRITREKLLQDWTLEFIEEYIFNIIDYLKKYNIEYNTLESSTIN